MMGQGSTSLCFQSPLESDWRQVFFSVAKTQVQHLFLCWAGCILCPLHPFILDVPTLGGFTPGLGFYILGTPLLWLFNLSLTS